jgi:hypothetical protein
MAPPPQARRPRRGRLGGRAAIVLLVGAAGLAVALSATAVGSLRSNPADHPRLLDERLDRFRYDYATGCRKGVRRGTRALRAWLERNVRGDFWGANRCERLGSGFSVHSEGRAIDWRLDAAIPRERRAARRLIRTLLAPDARGRPHALARRMGIQGWIFNCRQWFGSPSGLGPYSYCLRPDGRRRRNLNRTAAHMDHVHIELNWRGARMRTSFWQSPLASR